MSPIVLRVVGAYVEFCIMKLLTYSVHPPDGMLVLPTLTLQVPIDRPDWRIKSESVMSKNITQWSLPRDQTWSTSSQVQHANHWVLCQIMAICNCWPWRKDPFFLQISQKAFITNTVHNICSVLSADFIHVQLSSANLFKADEPIFFRTQMEDPYQMKTVWLRKIIAFVRITMLLKEGRDQKFKMQVFSTPG